MKISRTICAASLLAAGAMCMQSCSSSEDEQSAASVKINVETTEMTRMAYADENNTILTTWAANDALRIVPSNGSASQVFTLESGAETTSGTFAGKTVEVGTGTYTVLYPAKLTSLSDFYTFSYDGQIQEGDSSMAHVAAYHSVKLTGTTSDYSAINFANAEQSSLMVMTLKNLPASIGVPQQISLSADEPCFCLTNSTAVNEAALKLKNMKQTGTIKAYMMFGSNPRSAKLSSGKHLIIKVTGDKGVCFHEFTVAADVMFAGGKRNNINVSNWTTDPVPNGEQTIIATPTFGDGITIDDATQG